MPYRELCLGQFKNALVQLNEIFATKEDPDYNLSPPQAGEPIFQKARFRRARCYHEIGEHSAALGELNAYRDLAKSQIDLVEPQLRKKIEEVLKPYATEADISARQLTPFDYEVHVLPGNPSEKMTFVLKDLVPKEYCVPNPPRGPTTEFLTQLVTKHNHQFKKYIPKWTCWSCKKPADSLSHTPSTHLTLSPAQGGPKIIDYTLPVCERGGKCDKEAVTFMNEELTLMSRVMKN